MATDGAAHLDVDGDGPDAAFVARCDQTTAGGGWTLAWVYDFTARAADTFTTAANAVTPSPGWPLGGVDVEDAAGPPEGPETPGAIPWAAWEAIGTSFRHAHPLTGDLTCAPDGDSGGSLSTGRSGPVACEALSARCEGVVPGWVFFWEDGPGLAVSGEGGDDLFAYFDGSGSGSWPAHDPCGAGAPPEALPAGAGALWLR